MRMMQRTVHFVSGLPANVNAADLDASDLIF
jgi:hypothetical protein